MQTVEFYSTQAHKIPFSEKVEVAMLKQQSSLKTALRPYKLHILITAVYGNSEWYSCWQNEICKKIVPKDSGINLGCNDYVMFGNFELLYPIITDDHYQKLYIHFTYSCFS